MNLKSIIFSLITTVTLIVVYHFTLNSAKRSMAYIDTQQLMSEYKAMADAGKIVEEKNKQLLSTIDTLAVELQNDIKKFERERNKMSEREKNTTHELLARKQQQFLQYKQATQKRAEEEQQKITNDVVLTVNKAIADYGKQHHFTIVFGTNAGNIVYASESINITNEIIGLLNSEYDKSKK